MAEVMTVLGPVAPEALGITLPHEHLLLDLSCLWRQPRDAARAFLVDAPITPETRSLLLSDPYHSRANMLLDDLEVVAAEVSRFAALGGGAIVDLSTRSIGPYPPQLAMLARRSGLHIIAGTGIYVQPAHPAWVAEATVEDLTARMIAELRDGFAGSGVRAGIIGEIGTRSPIHPDEEKVLRAAARAHHATGVAINVHLSIFAREGHRVLDILLDQEQVEPNRVALSHLDELPDPQYHRSLAERGVYVEFDCFGSECYFDEDGRHEPSDAERVDALLRLCDAGYTSQVLISQDVCTKMQWRHFGGMGYDHILRTIVPRLRRRGLHDAALAQIMVDNPRRLLTPAAPRTR